MATAELHDPTHPPHRHPLPLYTLHTLSSEKGGRSTSPARRRYSLSLPPLSLHVGGQVRHPLLSISQLLLLPFPHSLSAFFLDPSLPTPRRAPPAPSSSSPNPRLPRSFPGGGGGEREREGLLMLMAQPPRVGVAALTVALLLATVAAAESKAKLKTCDKGWECKASVHCCNDTITDFFQVYQFENLFSKRNAPVAHAVGFWDYQSFITASSLYQPLGFGTTGGRQTQMKEVAAFLGHVGSQTSCGYGVATGGPFAWGLCYNRELSPSQIYCNHNYLYPCVDGVEYYGRGAIPVYWNYNYGLAGDALKIDLLHHPEYLEQNATLAFQAAMWRWMTPIKKKQPSAHDVFVGNWKPSKNDTLAKRLPGFGATMNVLYGDSTCGQGYVDSMNNIISHYQYYLDLMGAGREHSGDNLDCAEQVPFNPSSTSATS